MTITQGTHSLSGALRRATFKEAMRRFPSGVTLITTLAEDGTPRGFTASAFCSLSLEPPQILVCVIRGTAGHKALQQASHFAVNMLGPEHEETAIRFAVSGVDRFAGDAVFWRSVQRIPILSGALASLECAVDRLIDSGDHTIVIGNVITASSRKDEPLVYCDRQFRSLGDHVEARGGTR